MRDKTLTELVELFFRERAGEEFSSAAAAKLLLEEHPGTYLPSWKGIVSALYRAGVLERRECEGKNTAGGPIKSFVYFFPSSE